MMNIAIQLFGNYQVSLNAAPITRYRSNKVQALLAFLVAEHTAVHSRETLMTLLWPNAEQKIAQVNLRQTLYRLRLLLPGIVVTSQKTVELTLFECDGGDSADTITFERLLQKTRENSHAEIDLAHAVALYRGPFLADFYLRDSPDFEQWAVAKRAYYQQQYLKVVSRLADCRLAQGLYEEARQLAEIQIKHEPLQESAYRQLMLALACNDERPQALLSYHQLQQTLWDSLGLMPSERTCALVAKIKCGELFQGSDPPVSLHAFFGRTMRLQIESSC